MARITLGTDSSGRPLVVDDRTLAKLRLAEKRLGHTFVIVQGSWRAGSGAAASAATHDKGGVIDLRTWDLNGVTPWQALVELRKAGLIAWYRTNAQGFDPHIHAIDYGNPDLHPSAATQVRAWERGENGLASGGPDDGPKVPIPKAQPAPPKPPKGPLAPIRKTLTRAGWRAKKANRPGLAKRILRLRDKTKG